jgi:hypothetical protein
MKTLVTVALILIATTPAWSGKSNDYSSASFRAINQCYVAHIEAHAPPLRSNSQMSTYMKGCMNKLGFTFCAECRVFGDDGPRCKNDGMGAEHSWCWSWSTIE